jgi:fatty acid desaturase
VADTDRAARYRFDQDILAGARAAARPDNWHGPLEAVEHWAWIAFRHASLWRVTLLAAVLAWAVLGGWWPWLLLFWLVPLVTTQVWIGAVAELMEHFPLIETAPRMDIYMSWNRVYGFSTRFLLGEKDGEGFHLVHHLFPRTPMWRLREVDAILRRDPVYAALPRLGGPWAAWSRSTDPCPRRGTTPTPRSSPHDKPGGGGRLQRGLGHPDRTGRRRRRLRPGLRCPHRPHA